MMQRAAWHVIKLDERHYWAEYIRSQCQALWGIYAVDTSERTYCCSGSPSYALWYIDTVYEAPHLTLEADARLSDEILEGQSTRADTQHECDYVETYSIDAIMRMHPERVRQIDVSRLRLPWQPGERRTEHARTLMTVDAIRSAWTAWDLPFEGLR